MRFEMTMRITDESGKTVQDQFCQEMSSLEMLRTSVLRNSLFQLPEMVQQLFDAKLADMRKDEAPASPLIPLPPGTPATSPGTPAATADDPDSEDEPITPEIIS